MITLNLSQFEAQNARVTQSLQQHGAKSSIFSLYLAMQMDDTILHDACSQDKLRNEKPYESMYQEPIQNTEHLRSRLYSTDIDYQRHMLYFSQLPVSTAPSINLHFFAALMPQALHHSNEAIDIPQELINNLPFSSQQRYQTEITDTPAQDFDSSSNQSPFDNFFDHVENAREFSEQI